MMGDSDIQTHEKMSKLKSVLLPFGKTIYQSSSSISSDTAFLVDTILSNHKNGNFRVLELGSGNGIVSIMLAHYRPSWNCVGIEIQNHLVKLARQNSALAEVKAEFHHADIKTFAPEDKSYNLVVSNPPYFPVCSGRTSPDKERALAHHEIMCSMKDVLATTSKALSDSGTAYLLYPSTRSSDFVQNIKKVDLIITEQIISNKIKKGLVIFKLKKENRV